MTERRIVPIGPLHDRSAFSCGVQSLDDFIRNRVSQYERRGLGKNYVIAETGKDNILGYYTLAAGSLQAENLPRAARKLPQHPVPVALLGRLAVDQSRQSLGLGKLLLRDALSRAASISNDLGLHAVQVDAVNVQAATFYSNFGFVSSPSEPLSLYLLISTISSLNIGMEVSGRGE